MRGTVRQPGPAEYPLHQIAHLPLVPAQIRRRVNTTPFGKYAPPLPFQSLLGTGLPHLSGRDTIP